MTKGQYLLEKTFKDLGWLNNQKVYLDIQITLLKTRVSYTCFRNNNFNQHLVISI